MKYIKKPVIIEAKQLLDSNIIEIYEFIHGDRFQGRSPNSIDLDKWDDYEHAVKSKGGMHLKTLESGGETQIASFGDYIIKGVRGEFYPCKPDIFEETYEEVKEDK